MKLSLIFLLLISIFANAQDSINSPTSEIIIRPKLGRSCRKPSQTFLLHSKIKEGSGLVFWNGLLWTHNDSGVSKLYALDTVSGEVLNEYKLPIPITDWEDLSQDSDYFYLGDMGNNAGKREVVFVYRIQKKSLLANQPFIETISITWPPTQRRGKLENVNFDCEALAVVGDSIYLFTKEWKQGRRTRVFTVPKLPNKYCAKYKCTLRTKLLITGASYEEHSKQLVLCGHNFLLKPFLLHFSDFNPSSNFGKANKIKIRRCLTQMEGIAVHGKICYTISEDFKLFFIHTMPALFKIDL